MSFSIERFGFSSGEVDAWSQLRPIHTNWPVVYTLNGAASIYVGESLHAAKRMRQHLSSPQKASATSVHVVVDETFNKSVCLDLESFLIGMFAGDGRYEVLNSNGGITDADYYDRPRYRERFEEIFDELKRQGLFSKSRSRIVNSDLFKYSPFKALNEEQGSAVEGIVDALLVDLERGAEATFVVEGAPGTGKTIVAVFLIKLLVDIADGRDEHGHEGNTVFSDYFAEGNIELLRGLRLGFVVPQQSLRHTLQKVFARTPGLRSDMVLSPFEVGLSEDRFDVLIVDETHRLNQRANQTSGKRNAQFREINERLFGSDDDELTQLHWIERQSAHRILLMDAGQVVRPADLPVGLQRRVMDEARAEGRWVRLMSQMRVEGGRDYIEFVRAVLAQEELTVRPTAGYDLRHFASLPDMWREIRARESEHGLARLVAGYAWPWRSRRDKSVDDIVIDGLGFTWNATDRDWINSSTSAEEVGSIHTVQGYDLNYAGVIIGPDLRFDESSGRIVFDRANYFDAKGMENNRRLGIEYGDDDILAFVRNIYAVLMTRGMKGTYVYVCDEPLRRYLAGYVPLEG